jgi:hypothetical protein
MTNSRAFAIARDRDRFRLPVEPVAAVLPPLESAQELLTELECGPATKANANHLLRLHRRGPAPAQVANLRRGRAQIQPTPMPGSDVASKLPGKIRVVTT